MHRHAKRLFAGGLLLFALLSPVLAATQRWIAGSGVGLTWTSICTSELDTLASNSAIVCTTNSPVTNGTALDLYANFSIAFASLTSGTGSPSVTISIYPLNEDASTYGDGLFGSAAAGPPTVVTCQIPVVPAVSAPIVGTGSCGLPILLPPGSFKIVVWNNTGANLGSGNVVKYRTFNYQSN